MTTTKQFVIDVEFLAVPAGQGENGFDQISRQYKRRYGRDLVMPGFSKTTRVHGTSPSLPDDPVFERPMAINEDEYEFVLGLILGAGGRESAKRVL